MGKLPRACRYGFWAKARRQTSRSKIRLALNFDVAHRRVGIDIPGTAQCLENLEILRQPALEDSFHKETDNHITAGLLSCHFSIPRISVQSNAPNEATFRTHQLLHSALSRDKAVCQ